MYSQINTNTSHIQLIYIYLFGLQFQCFLYTCIFKYHKPACFEVTFGVYNQEIQHEYWITTPSIVKTAAAVEMKKEQKYY